MPSSFWRFRLAAWREQRRELRALYDLLRRSPGASVEHGVQIKNAKGVSLGPGTHVQRGTVLHAGGMAWTGGAGHIRIGKDVSVAPGCVLFGGGGLDIGDDCLLGPHVMVFTTEENGSPDRREPGQPSHFLKPVVLEQGVGLSAGSTVLPGVRMGAWSVAAAGAVVLKDVPPYAIVAGVPAKVIGDRRNIQKERLAGAASTHRPGEAPVR